MQRAFCLVLTFRTDELTRRHPFRRSLVENGRSVGARRLHPPPLGPWWGRRRDDLVGVPGATAMINGVDPARGMTLALDQRARARALGLPEVAERSGLAIAHGLISLGGARQSRAPPLRAGRRGTSPDIHPWRCARTRLLALQGATPGDPPPPSARQRPFPQAPGPPRPPRLLQHVEVLVASGLAQDALDVAREFAVVWTKPIVRALRVASRASCTPPWPVPGLPDCRTPASCSRGPTFCSPRPHDDHRAGTHLLAGHVLPDRPGAARRPGR